MFFVVDVCLFDLRDRLQSVRYYYIITITIIILTLHKSKNNINKKNKIKFKLHIVKHNAF